MFQQARSPDGFSRESLAQFLPWLTHVTPDLVLCKDGSLLSAFEFTGVDIDEDNPIVTETAVRELQNSLQALDERFYVWWVIDKRKKASPDQWESDNHEGLHAAMAARRRLQYENGRVFRIDFRIFISYTGDTGVYAFMDQVRRQMTEDGKSLPMAVLSGLNPARNFKNAVLHDAKQLDENIRQAEGGIRQLIAMNNVLSFRRLSGWDLDNCLTRMANISARAEPKHQVLPKAMLDGAAALSDVKFGREVFISYGSDRPVFGVALSLKDYPSTPSTIMGILGLQMEFRLVQVVKCMSVTTARSTLDEITRYYRMTQSTLVQRFAAYLNNAEPEVDPGKADLYMQCIEAMRRQMAENLGFVHHSMTLVILEESANAAETRANDAMRSLSQIPFIRERVGIKAAFLSMMPGQWATNQRLMLANAELVAQATPLITAETGLNYCDHLSGEVYGKRVPPLATFQSMLGTEVHFDPFVGQVGHTLMVMPTGGGKTTFVNFCLSQFTRYPDSQVIIFDRDRSCRIITGLAGGTHMDLRTNSMRLNPLANLRQGEIGKVQAREFLLRRIAEAGDEVTAEDRQELYRVLDNVAQSSQELSLSTVWTLLPRKMQILLSEWVKGGPFGYFDSTEDDFELSSWTCIEMREIMAVERLSRAFLDHALTVIARNLTGRPTMIYLEEASFLLNNTAFLDAIDGWLKTFRKLNAMVWLTVQSPESVSGVESERIRATLADNVPNLVLGYNPRLENHRDLYRTMFGMSNEQVSMIGELTPKRDYLRVFNGNCQTLRTNFDEHTLAYLRSEPVYQDLFDQAKASGRENWREWYIQQALRRKK